MYTNTVRYVKVCDSIMFDSVIWVKMRYWRGDNERVRVEGTAEGGENRRDMRLYVSGGISSPLPGAGVRVKLNDRTTLGRLVSVRPAGGGYDNKRKTGEGGWNREKRKKYIYIYIWNKLFRKCRRE